MPRAGGAIVAFRGPIPKACSNDPEPHHAWSSRGTGVPQRWWRCAPAAPWAHSRTCRHRPGWKRAWRQAQSDARLAESLLKTGRKAARPFCANCHGDSGNSIKPEVPNLAGQNTAYLLEQLQQFADGRRRDTFMQRMIHAMSADEKVGAVLYYASQKVASHRVRRHPKHCSRPGAMCLPRSACVATASKAAATTRSRAIAGQQPEYPEPDAQNATAAALANVPTRSCPATHGC